MRTLSVQFFLISHSVLINVLCDKCAQSDWVALKLLYRRAARWEAVAPVHGFKAQILLKDVSGYCCCFHPDLYLYVTDITTKSLVLFFK